MNVQGTQTALHETIDSTVEEETSMRNLFQLLAICVISIVFATSSIASAQTYLSVDFPGATSTILDGGPNPEGTIVGTYTDTLGVTHGFVLNKKGIFTSLDVPGSTATTPNLIDPQGTIVGSYLDASNISHGFILQRGNFTTVDFPGAAGTVLTGLSPTGEMSGFTCVSASCVDGTFHSFVVSRNGDFTNGDFTSFDPPGATSSNTAAVSPVKSSAITRIQGEWVMGTCSTTGRSPQSIFQVLRLPLLAAVTSRAIALVNTMIQPSSDTVFC